MFDLIIRGDNVVTPQGTGPFDVCVQGATIAAVTRPGTIPDGQAREVIDATGKIVMPGGIDPHIHSLWHIPPPALPYRLALDSHRRRRLRVRARARRRPIRRTRSGD